MIIKELNILNLSFNKLIKHYKFAEKGVNIILGEKRLESDEANGVGKTTMVEALRYILGSGVPSEFKNNTKLVDDDIFICLKIEVDGYNKYIGRRISKSSKGYLLAGDNLDYDIEKWSCLDKDDYKDRLNTFISIDENDDFKYTTISEFVIRDEKKGFHDITIPNRTAIYQHMYLAFLFQLPYKYENEIAKIKEPLRKKNSELKEIKALSKEVGDLKISEAEIEKDIEELQNNISKLKLSSEYTADSEKYSDVKMELNKVQSRIFKLRHIVNQYKNNIAAINKKKEISDELDGIDEFYNQMVGYFPDKVKKSINDVSSFYNKMVVNRGKYFSMKIDKLEQEISSLSEEKYHLTNVLDRISKVFKNDEIIEDIGIINEKLIEKNTELGAIRTKIGIYENKSEVVKSINSFTQDIIYNNQLFEDEFSNYEDDLTRIEKQFNILMKETYNEKGVLEFEYNNGIKLNDTTGRVKARCTIADEGSHGRLYMKINMFDLTWFLLNLNKKNFIPLLVHDGSYCKPDKNVKSRLLRFVDNELEKYGKGQYFVTINVDEISESDIDYFSHQKKIVAKLDRNNNGENRFFGFSFSG